MKSRSPPTWGSRNNTLEQYVDIAFFVANGIVLLITCFVGIAANLFVTWAVYHQKSLRTWNNALLVNLAVVDIFRCAVDCPVLFTIVVSVRQRGHVDQLICDTQVASFSFSCCIQLLTVACISAERYQAIAHPFKNSQRRKRIIILIPLTWILAIVVAIFCVLFVKDSPVYVACQGSHLELFGSYDSFGQYILGPLWVICFCVTIGFYARIFAIVRAHSRKIFDEGTFSVPKKNTEKDTVGDQEAKCGETDQPQTQMLTVEPTEQVLEVQLNASHKDNKADSMSAEKEPPADFSDSHIIEKPKARTKLCKWQIAYMKIVDARPGNEQPHPTVIQVETISDSPNTHQRISAKEPLNTFNDMANVPNDKPKSTQRREALPPTSEQPHGQVMQAETTTSVKNTASLSSTKKEPQKVTNDSNQTKKLKSTVNTTNALSGIEKTNPPLLQNAPSKDNMAGVRGTDEPQRVSEVCGVEKESTVIINVPSHTKQLHPEVTRDETDPLNNGIKTSLKSSTKDQRSVSTNSSVAHKSKAEEKTAHPQVTQLETDSLKKHSISGPTRPKEEAQNSLDVSGKLNEPNSGMKMTEMPSGTEQPCPIVLQVDSNAVPTAVALTVERPQATVPEPENNEKLDGAVCIMRPMNTNNETAIKKKESKMAKRSGYIILTFLLFWLPLIATILSNLLFDNLTSQRRTVRELEVLSVSVACMTSLSNPIIYAAVNPQFRTEFSRLKRKFKKLWKKK